MMRYFLFSFSLYFALLIINLSIVFALTPLFLPDSYNHEMITYTWQIAIYLLIYYINRLMTKRMTTINTITALVKSNLIALTIIFFIVTMTKIGDDTSRSILLLFFMLNMLIPIWSYLIKRKVLSLPYFRSKIYVICDTKGLSNIESWFVHNNPFGYDIDRIFNVDEESLESIEKKVETLIKSSDYAAAVIDIKETIASDTNHLIDNIQRNTPRIIIMPKITDFPMLNGELIGSTFHRGMAFYVKNNLLSPVDQWMKVFFDFITSIILILFFSPLLLLLYAIVYVSTKGHPLFKQQRIGHNGNSFMIYKFRTMYLDADKKLEELLLSCPLSREEWERDFKLKSDPRITKIGRFLRKTSLDELPQLINVLKGEMSLVGPRPIVNAEIKRYGEFFDYYAAVKPGITGLWQVSGRNDIEYDERVQLDVWYTRNWSIELDIQILLQTISVVLLRKGSY